jgi:hypothetical protein
MPSNPHADSSYHLMRVRIRKTVFERMQDLAEEQSTVSGSHVTVSDLVRAACINHLLVHEGLRQLEALGQEVQARLEAGDVLILPGHGPILGG